MNNKLQDAINDSLIYMAWFVEEYLDYDSIERIKNNAIKDGEDIDIYLWEAVYEVIKDMDSSPEQEYWFISWVKYAANILSNN
jgi:hypothetical protein